MPDGIYAAAAGMAAQQTRIDSCRTTSRTSTRPATSRSGSPSATSSTRRAGSPVGAGSAVATLGPTQGQGAIQPTDDPLSLALQGPGYFQVKQPTARSR